MYPSQHRELGLFFSKNPKGKLTNSALGKKGKGETKKTGHAVVIVGVGEDDTGKYFKIKNSWGTSHADDGYFRAYINALPFVEFHILD